MRTFKIAVVHHNADLDGIFSQTLARIFWGIVIDKLKYNSKINLEVDFIGYNYGKDSTIDTWLNPYNEEQNLKYDYIQFIDVTPPIFWIESVEEEIKLGRLYVEFFDHHKAVYDEITTKFEYLLKNKNYNFNFYFDNGFCAAYIYHITLCTGASWFQNLFKEKISEKGMFARLLWSNYLSNINKETENFFKQSNIISLINIVDSYDTWKWKNQEPNYLDALALNEYFLQWKPDSLDAYLNCLEVINAGSPRIFLNRGHDLIEFKRLVVENQKHLLIELEYDTPFNSDGMTRFVIINDKANTYSIDKVVSKIMEASAQPLSGEEHNPELECYINTKAIIFYNNIDFVENRINISVRHIDKNFDSSKFVKWLTNGNGGGHFGAAGGSLKLDKFTNLIQLNNIKKSSHVRNN